MACKGRTNIVRVHILLALPKLQGSHEDTGNAKAALECTRIEERMLQGMEAALIRRKSFDGRDMMTVSLQSQEQAATDGQAVEENGACPTNPLLTSKVCARQGQLGSQNVSEGPPRLDRELDEFTIND